VTGLARADDRDGVLVHAMGVADLDLLEAGVGERALELGCR